MKKIVRTLMIIIFILLFALISKASAASTGTITEDTVNVRKETSTDSKIVTYVYKNDKVEVIEKNGEWYKIKYKDNEGYVFADYIDVEETDVNNVEDKSEGETVTNTEVKLYISAGTKIKIIPNVISTNILTISKDSAGEILEQLNGWSYVNIEGVSGWIRNEQIKSDEESQKEDSTAEVENNEESQKEDESKASTEKAYVKYSSVNLRKEPSTDSEVIERLKLNTEVDIIEKVNNVWCKVKVGDKEGYISRELLSSEKQNEESTSRDGDTSSRETETSKNTTNETKKDESKSSTSNTKSTSTKGEEIVAYAKTFLGKPYVYGGSSPSGFDCSGFTSYVYKHFGYTLSRSAAGQASNGTKVEKSELQPGDLVIFKNNSLTKIGHVGIYIGDNKMIHASEPKTGVIITDIDSKAYKYPQRYVMGRRIL